MYHFPFQGICLLAEVVEVGFRSDSHITRNGKKSKLQWFYDYTYILSFNL